MPDTFDFESGPLKAKVDALREQLGITDEPTEATLTPDHVSEEPQSIDGSTIDWSEFELEPNYAHFYPQAKFRKTADGFKWVVQISEFASTTKAYYAQGINEKRKEPNGLAEYITYMVNSPEKWQIAAILPNGSGSGAVIFQRLITVVLPEPKLIETKTIVEKPSEPELQVEEDKALDWANDPGVDGTVEGADYNSGGADEPNAT